MNWFDKLARAAGKGMSRRDAFRTLGGGLLGALAVAAGAGRARAQESPYLAGCQIKCGELEGSCVNSCVACAEGTAFADPDGTPNPGIVCSAQGTLVCCPGTVYRTCKQASTRRFHGCVAFA